MEAKSIQALVILAALSSVAATTRTPNFVVTASHPEVAKKVAEAAEQYRKDIAIDWLGRELPQWYAPCPIMVKVGQLGAGGATTFSFDRGQVFGWKMEIQGSFERILDSVLPHEITHTILASHFRHPLPRWADEGAATLIEEESERRRQLLLLKDVTANGTRIPLRQLIDMREYPEDMREVLKLYAQGYSLADFLVQRGGKSRYLALLNDAEIMGWDRAMKKHYNESSIDALEHRWTQWVVAGSPPINLPQGQQLADASDQRAGSAQQVVVRGQSPDSDSDALASADAIPIPVRSAASASKPSHSKASPTRTDQGRPADRRAIRATNTRDNTELATIEQTRFERTASSRNATRASIPVRPAAQLAHRERGTGWELPVMRVTLPLASKRSDEPVTGPPDEDPWRNPSGSERDANDSYGEEASPPFENTRFQGWSR